MLKKSFLIITSWVFASVSVLADVNAENVNCCPQTLVCEESCDCGFASNWSAATVIGTSAVVAAAAGLLAGKAVKAQKGSRGSRGAVGPGINDVDVGQSLTFSNTITINAVIGGGGEIVVSPFIMHPDDTFDELPQTTLTTSGVYPISFSFVVNDPPFGRWEVGYNIEFMNAIGTTLDLSQNMQVLESRNNKIFQIIFKEQSLTVDIDPEDLQAVVAFPYAPIQL